MQTAARGLLITAAALLAAAATQGECVARELPWVGGDQPFFKIAQGQELSELLREFAADQGVPASVSEFVTGRISGQFGPMPAGDFLDKVTRENGVVWYFDGHALFFYRSDELGSRILQVRSETPDDMIEKLRRLDIVSDRFEIKTLPENGLMYLSGPPRYLEVIEEAVTSIESTSDAQVRIQMAVEVVPLRYAWADDKSFVFSGQQVIVPGVASILRSIVSGQQDAVGTQIGPLPVNNLAGLAGQGLKRRQNLAIAQAQQIAIDAQVAAAQSSGEVSAFQQYQSQLGQQRDQDGRPIDPLSIPGQGVVQADTRLNAIVIRDARARIDYFKKVIADLDRPSGLVHLEVNIVDVNADAGFEFGPPALAQWQHNGRLQTADFQLGNTQPASVSPLTLSSNLQFRLMDGAVTELLGQFEAMESDGRARIVSRPSVLTINNVEAHLEATSTFFVPVASQEDADLFDVTVGTTLRIVPHIVCEETGRRVKLIVRVEDGTQTPDAVSGIPVITRNTLNTQAVLNEGESLLLAGLFREEISKTENRVPVLGRAPVIGQLFTKTTSTKQKFDRMVLIRPRIIDLPPPGLFADSGLRPVEGFGMNQIPSCESCGVQGASSPFGMPVEMTVEPPAEEAYAPQGPTEFAPPANAPCECRVLPSIHTEGAILPASHQQ